MVADVTKTTITEGFHASTNKILTQGLRFSETLVGSLLQLHPFSNNFANFNKDLEKMMSCCALELGRKNGNIKIKKK